MLVSKKIHGSGKRYQRTRSGTTLLFSDEDINDIIKIIEALAQSGVLLKRVAKTIKNDINNESGSGIGMQY